MNHDQNTLRQWLQDDFSITGFPRSIHVAGTNGKGSVITWLECLLASAGKSCGSFISPHLISHNERFRFDGIPISLETWERVYDAFSDRFENRHMTMFEMDLFMACALFLEKKPDFVLMETGMGGGKDATSALTYPYGIITRIGLDHMAYLGETRTEIARSKAGIIKPGMTIVTAETDPDCLEIFMQKARETGARLIQIDRDFSKYEPLWKAHLPAYQKENFLCALTILNEAGFVFDQKQLARAMECFSWPARFQVLRDDPLVLLDGAHNPDGIAALTESLRQSSYAIEQIYFSVLADKQADEMLTMLQTICPYITLVRFDSYRLAELDALARKWSFPLVSFSQMETDLSMTTRNMLICGSLYFAGEVLAFMQKTTG